MWDRLKCFVAGCVLPPIESKGWYARCSRCGKKHFVDVRGPRWLPCGMIPKGGVGHCESPDPGAKVPPVPNAVHWQDAGLPRPRPRPLPRPK